MNLIQSILFFLHCAWASLVHRARVQLALFRARRIIRAARAKAPRGYDCFAAGSPVSPVQKGKTTIIWGTAPGGTAIAPVATGQTVSSIDIKPVNPKAVGEIENGDGSLITSVYLDDGFEATVEMVYDSALTYPANFTSVTLTLPTALDMSSGAVHTVFPCLVESTPVKFERKKESMVSFNLSHRPGRDGAPSA